MKPVCDILEAMQFLLCVSVCVRSSSYLSCIFIRVPASPNKAWAGLTGRAGRGWERFGQWRARVCSHTRCQERTQKLQSHSHSAVALLCKNTWTSCCLSFMLSSSQPLLGFVLRKRERKCFSILSIQLLYCKKILTGTAYL